MKLCFVLCALVAITWFGKSEGYTCSTCTAEVKSRCPAVPTSDDCEQVLDYCKCCTKCAIKENESCGDYSQRCETGFTCVKPSGPPSPPVIPGGPPPPTESYDDWWRRTRYDNNGKCTKSKS